MKDHRKKKKAKLASRCQIHANRLKVDKLASRNTIKTIINKHMEVLWLAKQIIQLGIKKGYKSIG